MSDASNMTFGSLFAGIGGIDLGLERAGMTCRWQVEINEYAQRVLARHWPSVRRHADVRTWPQPDTERVDVICGGFPCQGFSQAGLRKGLSDERSGLWFEFERIIRVLRPRFVLLENVAEIRARGFDRVLGSLASIGYDAEWHCIPAYYFGSPQIRDRIFVIAYYNGYDVKHQRLSKWSETEVQASTGHTDHKSQPELRFNAILSWLPRVPESFWDWEDPPTRLGMADGIPHRMDRLRGLGNAVVPQIAEWIGRHLIAARGAEDE